MSSTFKLAPVCLLASLGAVTAASAQTISLPLKAQDLAVGERYRTVVHTLGIQALGKDINGLRHVKDDLWSYNTKAYDDAAVKPPRQVTHSVIYNKPFYAMAAGTVVGCWRAAPENVPGSLHPWLAAGLMAGGGNHLWIQQDDGNMALYAHAVTNSIDAKICPNSKERFDSPVSYKRVNPDIHPSVALAPDKRVRVAKGQFLGRVGNSGSSGGGPHLHVHLEKAGAPVAMTLERGLFLDAPGDRAEPDSKWQSLSGKAWPEKQIIFWPPRSVGSGLTWNGTPAGSFQPYFDHFANSGYMADTLACRQGASSLLIDSTWVPTKGAWLGYFGLSAADYQARKASATQNGFIETARYTCNTGNGTRHTSVLRK